MVDVFNVYRLVFSVYRLMNRCSAANILAKPVPYS